MPAQIKTARIEDAEIAALAHRFYEEEGRPEGKAEEHWARAVWELQALQPTTPSAAPNSEDDLQRERERDTQASGKMG